MPIRFQCPACYQPIEVDDQWASRPVACPYCRQTVTAPASSTLEEALAPPTASPLDSPSQLHAPPAADEVHAPQNIPPSPPWYRATADARGTSNPYAPWALGLSCLALAVLLAINFAFAAKVASMVGPGATPEEIHQAAIDMQREMLDQAQAGELPAWFVALGLGVFLVLATWVAGIVLAILALRRPARRRMALAALIISAIMPVTICLGSGLGL